MDVDYEDFAAMNAGHAEAWLISFTTQLRQLLPSADGYISVSISLSPLELALMSLPRPEVTHAPVAPWFTSAKAIYSGGGYLHINSKVGALIDWYNVQFYNQGVNEYVDWFVPFRIFDQSRCD